MTIVAVPLTPSSMTHRYQEDKEVLKQLKAQAKKAKPKAKAKKKAVKKPRDKTPYMHISRATVEHAAHVLLNTDEFRSEGDFGLSTLRNAANLYNSVAKEEIPNPVAAQGANGGPGGW